MQKYDIEALIEELNRYSSDAEKQKRLFDLGFQFFDDDDYDASEIIEERNAKPENEQQSLLVSFLDGKAAPSSTYLKAYLAERESDTFNEPLLRKYFKAANPQLKALILYGLNADPASLVLLNDLSFFNEFDLHLNELIAFYLKACGHTENILLFEEIVKDFYMATVGYGYDPIHTLLSNSDIGSEKEKAVGRVKIVLEEQSLPIAF